MALPTFRAVLTRMPERHPVSHFLHERNAAEALTVTLTTNLPLNCPQARAEAWKKLPKRPVNTANYLQQMSAVLDSLGPPVSNANQQAKQAQEGNQRKILKFPARVKLTRS